MRNIIPGVIGALFGIGIIVKAQFGGPTPFGDGAYAMTPLVGTLLGLLMIVAGASALVSGVMQINSRNEDARPKKKRRDDDDEDDRPRKRHRRDDG